MNKEIFKLEQLLLQDEEMAIPFFFSYRELSRPTPYGTLDPDSIDWSKMPLYISFGPIFDFDKGIDAISVMPEFPDGDEDLLSVLDNTNPEDPDVYFGNQTAEQAYQIIVDRFLKYRATWWPEVYGPTS